MKYEMFDHVLLKTGEKGHIVEIYDNGEAFEFEQVPPPKDKLAVWEIKSEDIEKKLAFNE